MFTVDVRLIAAIESLQEEDITTNKKMAEFGANHILQNYANGKQVSILTHCNTGSLATAGYGTALGRLLNYDTSISLLFMFN